MSDMADIIRDAVEWTPYWTDDPATHQDPYQNAAAALSAAGFGPIRGSGLCGACGHVHDSSWTSAIGRFDETAPTLYRATYPQAIIRTSRIEAEADMCAHLTETP